MAYIDVRGPWPVYVRGMVVVTLEGYKRNVTVEQVELDWLAKKHLAEVREQLDLEEIKEVIAEFIPENEGEFYQTYCCKCERDTTHRYVHNHEIFELGLECMNCRIVWEADPNFSERNDL